MFKENDSFLVLGTHVDDLFCLFNPGKTLRDKVLAALRAKMEVDDQGTLSFALDMRIQRDVEKDILKLSQRQYIDVNV